MGKKRHRLSIFSKMLPCYHDVALVLYLTFSSFSSRLIGHLDIYQSFLIEEKKSGIRGNR